ncbi:MAG: diacylglycerol kinase [Luteibaculum sp.]
MSIKDEVKSFGYALKGAILSFREKHVRFHGVSFLLVCLANYLLELSLVEWAITIGAATGVIVAEVLNTAIEEIMDFIHPEKSPVVGKIKDLAAGAVFFAALGALLIAGFIYLPKILGF